MEGGDDVAGKGDVNTCTTAWSALALQLPSQEHQCQRFWWLSRFLPPRSQKHGFSSQPNTLFGRLNSRMNNSNGNLSGIALKKVVAFLPRPACCLFIKVKQKEGSVRTG